VLESELDDDDDDDGGGVRTSKRTPHFTITEINWLTLFKFNPLKPKLV
jgi:hypothetical protein